MQKNFHSRIISIESPPVSLTFARACADMAKPETKGTVLIKNAEQLRNYTKDEEGQMESIVKSIADSGANVIVSGNAIR